MKHLWIVPVILLAGIAYGCNGATFGSRCERLFPDDYMQQEKCIDYFEHDRAHDVYNMITPTTEDEAK